jgi:hypothetical protein
MPRNYKKEYENYHSKPEQKKNRAKRNQARAEAMRDGRASKGDGKDVDHKKPLSKGGSNHKSNTRVVSKSTNRSFARNKNGGMK